MTKSWSKQVAGLAVAAAVGLSAGVAKAEEYPELKLRLAHFVPSQLTGSKVDQWWADEIEKRSGGKIKIEIFWAESLGKAKEILDLVSSGAVDLGATAQGYFPSELPLFGATNSVMMGFDNNAEAVADTAAVAELPAVQKELQRNGIWPIFHHSLGGYRPFCTSPIKTLDDFKGKKMRAWGQYVPIMWEALGATGVNVLTQEIYEALQRGTVDCAFWSFDSANDVKLYEVAKYGWSHHLGAIPTWPIFASWENWHGGGWPDNVKKLLEEVGREAQAMDIKLTAENNHKALEKMVKEHGVQVVKFEDWDKLVTAMPDLKEVWVKNMKEKGLEAPAKEVVEYWRANATPVEKWDFKVTRPYVQ